MDTYPQKQQHFSFSSLPLYDGRPFHEDAFPLALVLELFVILRPSSLSSQPHLRVYK